MYNKALFKNIKEVWWGGTLTKGGGDRMESTHYEWLMKVYHNSHPENCIHIHNSHCVGCR